MTGRSDQQLALGRQTLLRKFHIMTTRVASNASGYELANKAALFPKPPPILTPPDGARGFRDYPEPPLFVADARKGRLHWDLEEYSDYWFVSERMKSLLQALDRDAFVFLPCEMRFPDGSKAPPRWLCDVVRMLDAVDEEKSEVKIGTADNGSKVYQLLGHINLHFRPEVVRSNRFFRLIYHSPTVICDDDVKSACKTADLKGLSFVAQGRPPRRPNAFAFYLEGNRHRERGDVAAAIVAYSEAIRLGRRHPFYSQYFQIRGDTYFQSKEFAGAVADYGEAIRLNGPDGAEGLDARQLATRLTRLANAHRRRGEVLTEQGELARAEQDFETARLLGYDEVLAASIAKRKAGR